MLDNRQASILSAAIEQYIQTGRPTGSSAVAKRLDQGLSTATIRTVLLQLEEEGYLYQPHTSAGRIPTDHGYRYYVDHLRGKKVVLMELNRIEQDYEQLKSQYQHLARATAELVSTLTQVVAVSRTNRSRATQIAGLTELFALPEAGSAPAAQELSAVIDALSDCIVELSQSARVEPQAYIGHEIPFYQAKHTSLMTQQVRAPNGQHLTVVIVGPKRMPYQRNAALLSAINDVISQSKTYEE